MTTPTIEEIRELAKRRRAEDALIKILPDLEIQAQQQADIEQRQDVINYYDVQLKVEMDDYHAARSAADEGLINAITQVLAAIADWQHLARRAGRIANDENGPVNQIAWAQYNMAHPDYHIRIKGLRVSEAKYEMGLAQDEVNDMKREIIARHNIVKPGTDELAALSLPTPRTDLEAELFRIIRDNIYHVT